MNTIRKTSDGGLGGLKRLKFSRRPLVGLGCKKLSAGKKPSKGDMLKLAYLKDSWEQLIICSKSTEEDRGEEGL